MEWKNRTTVSGHWHSGALVWFGFSFIHLVFFLFWITNFRLAFQSTPRYRIVFVSQWCQAEINIVEARQGELEARRGAGVEFWRCGKSLPTRYWPGGAYVYGLKSPSAGQNPGRHVCWDVGFIRAELSSCSPAMQNCFISWFTS